MRPGQLQRIHKSRCFVVRFQSGLRSCIFPEQGDVNRARDDANDDKASCPSSPYALILISNLRISTARHSPVAPAHYCHSTSCYGGSTPNRRPRLARSTIRFNNVSFVVERDSLD